MIQDRWKPLHDFTNSKKMRDIEKDGGNYAGIRLDPDTGQREEISFTKEKGWVINGVCLGLLFCEEDAATKSTDDRISEALAKRVARKLQDPAGNPTMSVEEASYALDRSKKTIYRYIDVESKLERTDAPGVSIRTDSVLKLISSRKKS